MIPSLPPFDLQEKTPAGVGQPHLPGREGGGQGAHQPITRIGIRIPPPGHFFPPSVIDRQIDIPLNLHDLIDDLLIAARADIGSVIVRSEAVELDVQVRTVIAGITVPPGTTVTCSVESSVVDADSVRVRQILRNLLTNAVRYGGTNIEARMSSSRGAVAVEIVDDGAGIPEADRERIFEAYERAHDTPGQPGSVGIGLTVSRALAE